MSIKNFLDIFAVLLRLPCSGDEETVEDSNLLSGEGNRHCPFLLLSEWWIPCPALQVVDQVLQEELVLSYSNTSHSTAKLLCPLPFPSLPPTSAKMLETALPVSSEVYPTPASKVLQSFPLHHSTPHKGLWLAADHVCIAHLTGTVWMQVPELACPMQ